MKNTLKTISLAALFLVPIAALFPMPFWPFDFTSSLFFPFITGKAFYFRILVEIAFACWAVLALMDATYRPRLTPLSIGVTVFAAVALIADLAGVNPIRSLWSNYERMEGWITIIHLWAFFIAAQGLFGSGEEGKRSWHRWFNVELVVALVVAVYGLLQLMGRADIHQGSTRIDASLGNAAYMAVYMLWNAGLAAYLFLVARAKQLKNARFLSWYYPILAVLFSYEVFETATRGTILGLLGAVLLSLFIYAVWGRQQPKKRRWIAAAAMVAIVILGGIFWSVRSSPFVQNNEVLQRLASISWSEAQGQARNFIWPMALKGFADRPILGWGQENFNYVFNANYVPQMWNQEQWFDRAHNVYLDWLIDAGILGLIAYAALYILLVRRIWKSGMTFAEKSILTGVVAGYAVHNVFVFDNLMSYILFFAALAFVDSMSAGKAVAPARAPVSKEAAEYVALPAAIIAFVAVLYAFTVRPVQENTKLIAALQACAIGQPSVALFQSALAVNAYVGNQEAREQYYSCATRVLQNQQITGDVKQAFFEYSREVTAEQEHATVFKDARTYALAGQFMNGIDQFSIALPLLETAHELSPGKQSVDAELALDLINARRATDAIAFLKPDYEAAPEDQDLKDIYAVALIAAGKSSDALALYGGDQSKLETQRFAQAYLIAGQSDKAIAIYKKLLAADPTNADIAVTLARAQYSAGDRYGAVETLRGIEQAHPEYKSGIEAAIQQLLSK